MEVYLNVAETGPGIYGVQAAARHYYKIPASKLDRSQAASIAICLPNPRRYVPTGNTKFINSRRQSIITRISQNRYPDWVE